MEHLEQELVDKRAVNGRTEESIYNLLSRLAYDAGSSPLVDWEFALHKEKAICNIFMKSHFYLTMIAVEGWCPTVELNDFKDACRNAVIGTGHPPAAVEVNPANPLRAPDTPPTYFRLNKFTATFQGIVDTYGVPRYKEVNPGLFTVISFPFLFGVMYGDIGHGVLLTLFALVLIRNEAKLEKSRKAGTLGEIPSMAFGGRYVLLMMGAFAIYCGMIYNDVMSIPTHLYTSNYGDWYDNPTLFDTNSTWEKNQTLYPINNLVYPVGVDPSWYHKQNTLAFFNSMKMKMAVILGVTQMMFGLFLMCCNHWYFSDRLGIYYEFLPRFVFLLCTFGYMDWMIIYKWSVDWVHLDGIYSADQGNTDPPNLIQSMINMFLHPGSELGNGQLLYNGQTLVQAVLVLCALGSVPFMLCGKPCANRSRHKKAALARGPAGDDNGDVHQYHEYASPRSAVSSRGGKDDEKFAMGGDSETYNNDGSGASSDDYEEEKAASMEAPAKSNGGSAGAAHGGGGGGGHGHGDGEYSFSDEMIHNAIHTIEFVLGCVSNTASYLRLWALSLAHAQLAEVFWDKMIMQYGVTGSSVASSFIGFAVWAMATFAVLLCMDVLECFLHALRLHWVEFQNKCSTTQHNTTLHTATLHPATPSQPSHTPSLCALLLPAVYYADGIAFEPFAFYPAEF